jgi:hypothetical protein
VNTRHVELANQIWRTADCSDAVCSATACASTLAAVCDGGVCARREEEGTDAGEIRTVVERNELPAR